MIKTIEVWTNIFKNNVVDIGFKTMEDADAYAMCRTERIARVKLTGSDEVHEDE